MRNPAYIRGVAELRLEFPLRHPPERVWRALTEPALLGSWFMPVDRALRQGDQVTLDPGTRAGFLGPVAGEVIELVAPGRVVMRWWGEKLHTRVSWVLAEHPGGCTVRVVQTGFLGVPAGLRREALQATYAELFGQRLPQLLDRLAAGGQAEVRPAVPRQRRRANLAVTAWSAGRPLRPATSSRSERAGTPVPRSGGAAVPAATSNPTDGGTATPSAPTEPSGGAEAPVATGVLVERSGGVEAPVPPGRSTTASWPVVRLAPPVWRAWWRRLPAVPAWARAWPVSAAAAVLALVVLAGLAGTTGNEVGGAPRASEPGAPGMAVQPGEPVPPGSASPTAAGVRPTPETSDRVGPPPPAVVTPGEVGTVGSAAPPVLAATMAISGPELLGLRLLRVIATITVSNPGPGTAPTWEVVVDVDGQPVSDVVGAVPEPAGSHVIFTLRPDGRLPPGAVSQLSFEIQGLAPRSPTGCTIDGHPCE